MEPFELRFIFQSLVPYNYYRLSHNYSETATRYFLALHASRKKRS